MNKAPVFCLGGKFGDIILFLPAFKAIYDRTGLKPKVIVSRPYASVFEGVSYVEPIIVDSDWMDIPSALAVAKQHGTPNIPAWWLDKTSEPEHFEGGLVLRVNGKEWHIDQSKYPGFTQSMYLRAGFTVDEMMKLPLVFDQRDAKREAQLVKQVSQQNRKPMLLVNFSGETSPFPMVPEIMRYLIHFQNRLNIVRLDNVRATRIYDLLGLMDNAIGMLTVDTSTLHLAHGSKTPYIAFTRDGWSGSVPRGNCALDIKYSVAIQRGAEIPGIIESWLKPKPQPLPVEIKKQTQCWMLHRNRISMKGVTLWGSSWSTDQMFYSQTLRVLRYCDRVFEFDRVLFFSYMAPPRNFEFDYIQIPELNMSGFGIFINRIVPLAITSDFAMSVHEDGFPIRPDLWNKRFLDYDYIGAPWSDGVVGNGGLNIESKRMMEEKMNLPPYRPPIDPSDNYVCRTHRGLLESRGIRFAPTDVALEFSTELTGAKWPSFGFHGRRWQPDKFNLGWKLIEQSEQ